MTNSPILATLSALLACFAVPLWADADDDAARAVFAAAFADACSGAFLEDGSLIEGQALRWDVMVPSDWSDPLPVSLWQFRCQQGAYNAQFVFIARREFEGFVPLAIARPDIAATHEVPGDDSSALVDVAITGWGASLFVVNAEFDPNTLRLQEFSLWRGLGDASSSAIWTLTDGAFVLERYEVDPTYDGQVNPVRLVGLD